MDQKTVHTLWAQIEPHFIQILAKKGKPQTMLNDLDKAAQEEDDYLRRKIPRATAEHLPEPVCGLKKDQGDASKGSKSAVQAAATSPTMEKLTTDARGRVTCVSGAPQAVEDNQEEEVDWKASEKSVRANRCKIKLANALWEANSLLPAAPVKVIGCVAPIGSKKKRLHQPRSS